MKLSKILILLSFIFICITRAQAIVTYNENGVKMEYFYDSNGKLHGPMTWFFPNGGIMQQNLASTCSLSRHRRYIYPSHIKRNLEFGIWTLAQIESY